MVSIVDQKNKILHKKAKPVALSAIGTPKMKKLISDMKKALSSAKDGVAIAAPQVGAPLRMFIVSGRVLAIIEQKEKNDKKKDAGESEDIKPLPDRIFINPELVKISKERKWVDEGCLSVRYLYGKVHRATKARIRAYDEKGRLFEQGGSGLLAQIFQHEYDHLEGTLFIEKAKDVIELTKEEFEKDA